MITITNPSPRIRDRITHVTKGGTTCVFVCRGCFRDMALHANMVAECPIDARHGDGIWIPDMPLEDRRHLRIKGLRAGDIYGRPSGLFED